MARKQETKTTTKKKTPAKRTTKKAVAEVKAPEVTVEEPKAEAVEEVKEEPKAEAVKEEVVEEPKYEAPPTSRRSVAFIGSECYPFVKTGGLGDVMYALPKALVKQNCDVKVIIPR